MAQIQMPAPDFECTALMPGGAFGKVKLSDYKGKWLVLFFYPLDFTFVCPTEIIQFSDRLPEFEKINCAVVAGSVDSEFSHLAWTKKERRKGGLGPMNIPILADLKKKVSRAYGCLLPEGCHDEGVALRATYIIDHKGVVRHISMNDLPIGRNIDEVLRLLQALQFHESNGDVCPMNWKPGAKTIKADPDKSQEYFEAAQAK